MKKEVREFLESLEEEDVLKIKKALRVYDSVETLGSIVKWLLVSILSIVVAITQFKDSLGKLFPKWFF